MASISKGWSTSFIYKQDLTSYYMNSLLRTIVRPGIYNANMGICNHGTVTVGSQRGQSDSLCLYIKKGTTFVFSNDYKNDDSLGYRRNFNHVDESYLGVTSDESFCLIKSVALSDMYVFLGVMPNDGVYSIQTFMYYNPLTTGMGDTDTPTFFLVKENTDSENNDLLYKIISETRYSSGQNSTDQGMNITEGNPLIIEGKDSLNAKDIQNNFYLNVGFIKVVGGEVVSFTGRGLPEYRYSSNLDSYKMIPDIIPDMIEKVDTHHSKKTLYFDIPESFIGTAVIKNNMETSSTGFEDSNWEGAYFNSRSTTVSKRISFGEDGTFAVYGLVSNIVSFNSDPSIRSLDISFKSTVIPSSISVSSTTSLGDVPLDVSLFNVYSLLSSLENKDIWSYVIDSIRQDSDSNPNEITDIIPIALVTVKDGAISHSKTLCYFGLQERLAKINTLNVREHNIFNVIPVMN